MKLSLREKASYGLGAVGKDMVYMLSASYILYYYQDLLGIKGTIMGAIMMAARIFDAFNDPIMGVIVAKTKSKWGKFRPWLMIGTITNAIVLYLVFSAPPSLTGSGLVAYAAIFYVLWGVTYTMMDIPFWSMIPAFTEGGKEREGLTAMARSCAGVGSALITVITMLVVPILGGIAHPAEKAQASNMIEITGFSYFALIVAVIFIVFITITCVTIKEKSSVDMESPSIGTMFKALVTNDQAMAVVITIVLVNASLYITSNLLIYFFKYDIAGENWNNSYVLFNTFGGGMQIISMMVIYPLVRKIMSITKVCYLSFSCAIGGYAVLLIMMMAGAKSMVLLFIPGFFVFVAFGLLTVLTTVFLANTVDYGEYKNGRRDESVIFSMQTFVVKLASGVAVFITGVALDLFNISKNTDNVVENASASSNIMGLRMTMTILPIAGLLIAVFIFAKKYILTDEKLEEITASLRNGKGAEA
ncbi:MAG: glycoside-pentoside-hexuronide (GPH):cation symporter [Lachnospiraceae bacterium]|nr:glycoside-pentoside-hexuronide (GPH):cation symporter [Lachnospiraceae bacterium]